MPLSIEAAQLTHELAQGNLRIYEGQWIAIHETTILGNADLLDDLLAQPAVRAQFDYPSSLSADEKVKRVPLFMYVMGENFQ